MSFSKNSEPDISPIQTINVTIEPKPLIISNAERHDIQIENQLVNNYSALSGNQNALSNPKR